MKWVSVQSTFTPSSYALIIIQDHDLGGIAGGGIFAGHTEGRVLVTGAIAN